MKRAHLPGNHVPNLTRARLGAMYKISQVVMLSWGPGGLQTMEATVMMEIEPAMMETKPVMMQ